MLDSVRDDPVLASTLLSILLGVGLFIEACVHIKRGYLFAYRPISYLYFRVRAGRPARIRRFLPGATAYQLMFITRMVAASALIFGQAPRVALIIVAAITFLETRLYFNFHSAFFVLLSVSLLFSPVAEGGVLHLLSYESTVPFRYAEGSPSLGLSMAGMLLLSLYWGGVRRKANRSFVSGNVIVATLNFLESETEHRRHHDSALPASWRKYFANLEPGSPMPMLLTSTVLSMEILIPIGLMFSCTQAFAIGAGMVLHGAFFLLFPGTLASFSIVTLASYVSIINVSGALGL
ncbi:hypothetical protein [Nocardia rhamnosiphila]|uniref:hypothetical protein n=1 Tax=Nocardia rhamnosiphila TaxID=426716 RepID=UPI0004C44DA0|nr:hypothetical protein [Nocardia rhamnosiphila]